MGHEQGDVCCSLHVVFHPLPNQCSQLGHRQTCACAKCVRWTPTNKKVENQTRCRLVIIAPNTLNKIPTSQRKKHTRRQRLLQLVGLVGIRHDQGVQVSAAANLELDIRLGLHDLDVCHGKEWTMKNYPSVDPQTGIECWVSKETQSEQQTQIPQWFRSVLLRDDIQRAK